MGTLDTLIWLRGQNEPLPIGQQKITNPYCQMTVAERNARWEELHRPGALEKLPDNKDRQNEMTALWDSKVRTLTLSQLIEPAHKSLDILGIEN